MGDGLMVQQKKELPAASRTIYELWGKGYLQEQRTVNPAQRATPELGVSGGSS